MDSVPFEFISSGSCVRGHYFAAAIPAAPVLLYIPGWPGEPGDGFMDLYPLLAERGIHVFMFNPRGFAPSEGVQTQSNTLHDIALVIQWLKRADVQARFGIEPSRLALGGHSFGGGMSMAYAAQDASIRQVVSIAGPDLGELARQIQTNATFARRFRSGMMSSLSPQGPVRFDYEAGVRELVDHPEVFGQKENAARLADRSILLVGGWEDEAVMVETFLLPVYRALRKAGARSVSLQVYPTDHTFRNVRGRLAEDVAGWLRG